MVHYAESSSSDYKFKGSAFANIVRDFKKFTSKEIIRSFERINESRKEWLTEKFKKAGDRLQRITHYKVWQDGNHPQLLFSSQFTTQKLDY